MRGHGVSVLAVAVMALTGCSASPTPEELALQVHHQVKAGQLRRHLAHA